MSTHDDQERADRSEDFRDSGLDEDSVADAFDAMQAAPGGGALLEGETADEDGGEGQHHKSAGDEPGGGADVASGGGEGEREPTSGAVGERDGGGQDGGGQDGGRQDDDRG